MKTLKEIAIELHEAKKSEDSIKAWRVALEKEFADAVGVPEQWEGARTSEIDEFKFTVKRSMNVKIDPILLREIAVQHDLQDALSTAFSWKPELFKKGWEALTEESRIFLSEAITKTPGKIGITIKLKEEN